MSEILQVYCGCHFVCNLFVSSQMHCLVNSSPMFEGNQKLWVRVTLNIHDKMSPKFQNAFRVSVYSTCTCKVTMSPTGFPTLLNTVPRDPAGQGLAGTGQGVNFLPQLGRPLGFISHHNTDPEGCIIHEETICKVLQYIGGCQVRNQTPLLKKIIGGEIR